MSNIYQVKVDGFEGPLDLLLHLINRYEIDIYDIPVSQITDQYMNFIHTMQELELDVASEYLVMAATLLAIKSQMLLPNQSFLDPDEEEVEDPREDLMKRLIEYRKFKGAADDLKEKELEANRIYTRPQMSPFEDEKDKEITSAEASVFDMIQAMGALMKREQGKKAAGTKIKREEIPIQMRMEEILGHVRLSKNGTEFTKLFDHMTRPHIVVTFMALLELMKSNEVFCVQDSHFSELILFPRKEQ